MVAASHCDIAARLAIAPLSATDAMLAAADACNAARHGQESRWRLFLSASAALADIGSAALSWPPIER
jgi:hypothetical protein